MKKELAKKITIILLLVSVLVISACSGAYYGRNKGCSEGDLCSYYTGNMGVLTMLDRPPTTLYYRSSQMGEADANAVELNVRLRNDGPSESYGGVFLSGVSSESFKITRIDDAGERDVMVSKNQQACYIDLFNIRDLTSPSTWNFMASCFGAEYSQYGDRRNINVGFDQISELFGNPSWLKFLADNNINVGAQWANGEMTQFSIGGNFAVVRFGRALMILIAGLNFEAFGGMPFYLQGDNPEYPGGEIDFKTFRLQLVGPWPAGQDYYRLDYNIKTCYAYTTFVSPMVCIDPDPYSDETKVCNDFSFSWSGSQGAPVAVSRITSTNTGDSVIIQATIRNIGPGTVWDVGYLEYCSPYFPATVKPVMKNVVYIGHMHIGNRVLDCSNRYKIHLDPRTQEGTLTCRYDLVNTDYVGSAYSQPLRMELWYGYEENMRRQLTIRRLN